MMGYSLAGYFWIGVGGALGSITRAWVAVVVTRITGPLFPWGTILINIVGSFIIGFFGTLTINDGRFAVPADMRAFVMVGICGGFTTFSSFSLQTLELARDGRAGQALGNIVLSVVMCLLAVAAGHYGAASIHAPVAVTKTGDNDMANVALAVLNHPNDAESLLNAGTRLLEIGGGGHLKALAVRMPPVATILPSEEVLTAERETAIHAEQENWAGQLHDVATGWNALAARHGVHVDWIDLEGDAPRIVVEHGRRADTILVSCPVDRHDYRMRECVHAALFETETPVLMVPRNFEGPLGHVIAIAWKDDERATKAVRAAIPLLRDAKRVHVLRANHPAEMPPILKEHDIAAELHNVPDGDTPAAERILAAAHQLDADVLVMGAFAHGEWREMIFGGVTRYMLASADLPLLMRH